MARATSGLGQFRGKVGSVVFRVSQGQQIASAYQPAVRNPKSNLQTAQRNKMYLASQLSKLVPREDIIGLNPRGTARDRRSMFIKNIIENTTSTLVDGIFTSSINNRRINFSSNEQIEGLDATFTSPNNGSSTVTLTFDKSVITEDKFNRMAIKLIQLDIVNNFVSYYKSSWLNLGQYNTESQDTFSIDVSVSLAQDVATYVFIIPVEVADNVRYSSEKKTLIQSNADTSDIVITGEYAINNAVLKWYKSGSLGPLGNTNDLPPVVPPSGSGDEVVNPDGPNFPNLG